ncbi:MAG: Lysophospholipase [Verrucomicrobiaceae bacterium]|nr:Lysophospholipase [Verrucomicrobiaceae bacterium]
MTRRDLTRAAFVALAMFSFNAQGGEAAQAKAFAFKNDDAVVLLGSTVIEREQHYGYFESWLQLAEPDKTLSVRNLGWSGDTVFGHARSYFGPPEEGIQRLTAHLEMLKPSVMILCYGSELAHEGLGGVPEFLKGYRALLDLIREKSPGVRLIIASPPPLENLAPPLPDQQGPNKNLAGLSAELAKFSQSQNAYFVDWFAVMGGVPPAGLAARPLTENGIHYTEAGYQKLASTLIAGLGLKTPDVPTTALEPLRKQIVAKDTLFFDRWRPQNETYLFGFRKHEQGQNAKEIPMFDPLIATADKKIQELKATVLASAKRP